jgi:hypothetical protein
VNYVVGTPPVSEGERVAMISLRKEDTQETTKKSPDQQLVGRAKLKKGCDPISVHY